MELKVRPATQGDTPAWLALRCDLWPGSATDHATEIAEFFAGLAREPLEVLLAEDERRRIVGFVELSIRPYAEGGDTDRVAYLEGWFVAPDCRRRGVGRRLIAASEEWALSQGCTELGSNTEIDNLESLAAHLATGFVEVGSTRNLLKLLTAAGDRSAHMPPASPRPKLYSELASWWPLMSPAYEYVEEAAFYQRTLQNATAAPIRTVLELGSGGGNNASHMKIHYEHMVLVELSPEMIANSRALNPELEHHQGDMRTVRLGRQFDAIFVHDAICYMTTEKDLRQAIETAYEHCKPGGVALFAPDYVRENFKAATEPGGEDDGARGMRWMSWMWDPDPCDCTYLVDYAYLLKESDGSVRVEHDRHLEGLFPRDTWLQAFKDAGFEHRVLPFEHSDLEPGVHEVFVCRKPTPVSSE